MAGLHQAEAVIRRTRMSTPTAAASFWQCNLFLRQLAWSLLPNSFSSACIIGYNSSYERIAGFDCEWLRVTDRVI